MQWSLGLDHSFSLGWIRELSKCINTYKHTQSDESIYSRHKLLWCHCQQEPESEDAESGWGSRQQLQLLLSKSTARPFFLLCCLKANDYLRQELEHLGNAIISCYFVCALLGELHVVYSSTLEFGIFLHLVVALESEDLHWIDKRVVNKLAKI